MGASAATTRLGVAPLVGGRDEPAPAVAAAPARNELSVQDLAELMSAINDVTAKLQTSHDRLQAEVARLNAELREANAQIERSRRLAALGEMAAGISHEVRNPLGSIRLYARMLEQDLAGKPEQQGVATKILRAATSLDAIVGDVLSFAREFRPQPTMLVAGEVIERAIEASDPRSHAAWREISIARDGEAGIEFEGDTNLVQQALVNIVRNALEAMAECGEAGPHELRVGAERVGERVLVRVRDTGPGVSAETVKRMFNPFFTTRSTGTGLGLSIVHRIVDAHGGVVRVRNNRDIDGGKGASVELEFPLKFGGKSGDHSGQLAAIAEGKPLRVTSATASPDLAQGGEVAPSAGAEGERRKKKQEPAGTAGPPRKSNTQHHRQEQR